MLFDVSRVGASTKLLLPYVAELPSQQAPWLRWNQNGSPSGPVAVAMVSFPV